METLHGTNWLRRPNVKNVSARSMPSSGERTVVVAHHPMEIQPWQQTPYPGGTSNLSRDHGHRLVAKEARARSSVIDAEDVTAALARRELVQHGARSVAFAERRTTTRQSVRRLLRCNQEEAPNPSSKSKGKANLLVRMEKQRPNTLTPSCLRRSHQQRGQFPDRKKLQHQTRSLQNQVYL